LTSASDGDERPDQYYAPDTLPALKLREEHRLRVFEDRVVGRIFGPKKEEVMGEGRSDGRVKNTSY
jgi:hypothetical protein